MSLKLDPRQRAMLAEMGVPVWWPASEAPADAPTHVGMADLQADSDRQNATEDVAGSPYPERARGNNHPRMSTPSDTPPTWPAAPQPAAGEAIAPVASRPKTLPADQPAAKAPRVAAGTSPTAVTALPAGIEHMDWPALQTAVAACQACVMCLGRRAPVMATPAGPLRADWLVLGEPPDDVQERAGEPFVDDAGLLLDNMLKAVGVQRHLPGDMTGNLPDPARTAYLSLVLKCRPALPTAPDAPALAACAHYLRREIALVQPKVILAMGRLAMQVLLSQDHPQGLKLPLGKLRGQVWHYEGVPVVVTYPPAYLLRTGQDKARAWEDLCLALNVVQGQLPCR